MNDYFIDLILSLEKFLIILFCSLLMYIVSIIFCAKNTTFSNFILPIIVSIVIIISIWLIPTKGYMLGCYNKNLAICYNLERSK